MLTVFPNNGRGNSCVFVEQGLGNELITLDSAADNFNPTNYSGEDRVKTVVITVEPALSGQGGLTTKLVDPCVCTSPFFSV